MTKKDWEDFSIENTLRQEALNRRLDRIITQYKEKIQEDSFSKDFILYISDLIRYEKFYDADNEMDYLEDHLENEFVKERKRALQEA